MEALALEKAVVDEVRAFIGGSLFAAQVDKSLRAAVQEASSPWVDRAGAAARWRTSLTGRDRAVAAGILTRYEVNESTRYMKAEGDEAIKSGRWKQR